MKIRLKIIIISANNRIKDKEIKISNSQIASQQNLNELGITLDQTLNWNAQRYNIKQMTQCMPFF